MKSEVLLRSSHLVISSDVANLLFTDHKIVFVAYKADNHSLLVSPQSNTWFQKLHDASEFLLKNRDMTGTRSIAIREILLDHELDDSDRPLPCFFHEDKLFLKIDL